MSIVIGTFDNQPIKTIAFIDGGKPLSKSKIWPFNKAWFTSKAILDVNLL